METERADPADLAFLRSAFDAEVSARLGWLITGEGAGPFGAPFDFTPARPGFAGWPVIGRRAARGSTRGDPGRTARVPALLPGLATDEELVAAGRKVVRCGRELTSREARLRGLGEGCRHKVDSGRVLRRSGRFEIEQEELFEARSADPFGAGPGEPPEI